MTSSRRLLGLILSLVLIAGACSGGESGTSTSTLAGATTTVASPDSTAAPDEPDDTTTTTVVPTTTTEPPAPLKRLALEPLVTDLPRVTYVTGAPGDDLLYLVEAQGRILRVDPEEGLLEQTFLNIRNKVGSNSIEQGLLGLAFHPDYANNGRVFVYYTDRNDNSRLVEYHATADRASAVSTDEKLIIEFDQPDVRHNAGMIQFGPDGYLYLALGDGGAGGASVNGQHPETLLASIIRIDIDSGDPYSVPADNPFADGVGGRPEVWSYGLQTPWRISLASPDHHIYIGDVGQGSTEEINIARLVPRGHNFGWDRLEGTTCYTEACDSEGTVLHALEYSRSDGLSVTGGFVYRGLAIPELTGHYFYADWVSEWIRSFRFDGATVSDQADWTGDLQPGHVTSFGVDNEGELYITTWFSGPDGALLKIVPIR